MKGNYIMLWRIITAVFLVAGSLVSGGPAEACVGRILQIGALDTPDGRVMGEALALMINERTGTTVETNYFADSDALYAAVAEGEIGILVENTAKAMQLLGQEIPEDLDEAYKLAKMLYRKKLNLVWLDPFKFSNNVQADRPCRTATLVSNAVMEDFPGLPRLLNKLAKRVSDRDYTALVETVKAGEDPRGTAMEFLNTKKLI